MSLLPPQEGPRSRRDARGRDRGRHRVGPARVSDAMPVALLLLLIGLCALPSRARSAAMPYRVMDIRPGPDGSSPGSLTGIGEALYFSADDGEHGLEVWRSDGTAAGTVMLVPLLASGISFWASRSVLQETPAVLLRE